MNIWIILSIVWLVGLLIAHVVAMIKNELYRLTVGIVVTVVIVALFTVLATFNLLVYFKLVVP